MSNITNFNVDANSDVLGTYNPDGSFKKLPKRFISGGEFSRVGGGFTIIKTKNMPDKHFVCARNWRGTVTVVESKPAPKVTKKASS